MLSRAGVAGVPISSLKGQRIIFDLLN